MFCATVMIAAGQCVFACSGSLDEFKNAWQWPGTVRWDNAAQELVDDYGKLPLLRTDGAAVIWSVESEPEACAGESAE